jgi:hypothetical protein
LSTIGRLELEIKFDAWDINDYSSFVSNVLVKRFLSLSKDILNINYYLNRIAANPQTPLTIVVIHEG